MSSPQIALVGTTRAGKSVLMTVLAKRLENKRNGVWLKPLGKTYSQIEEWWDTLQSGEWLPPTTPGTLLELNWDLCIQDKRIPMRMFDYAGENLTDLFSGKADNQQGAAKEFFDKVKDNFDNSTIIIVLLNLESFLDPDKKTVRENKGTPINAMTDFLKQAKNRSEELHIAFVFTAFDRYKATIEGSRSKYGSYEKFLRQEIPPLYNEFIDTNSPVRVFAVSAVADTETFTDTATGKTESRPKPGFRSEGIAEFLIPWLSQAVLGAQTQIDIQNEEARQDAENGKYVTELVSQWNSIVNSEELQAVERIITEANKPLPYPNRPGASALNTERNKVLNYAIDLRSKIQTRQWENTKALAVDFFKGALVIVAIMFVIWIGAGVIEKIQNARTQAINDELQRLKEAEIQRKKDDAQKAVDSLQCIFRVSLWGYSEGGKVAIFSNLGDKTIRCNCTVQSRDGNSKKNFFLVLNPGDRKEIGWNELDGWRIEIGEKITLKSDSFEYLYPGGIVWDVP